MELRSRPGINGSQTKPRATPVDRKREGNSLDNTITTLVNPPSSATGITRGGKSPSRILPAEGGRTRTSSPQPCSESAGGADKSPKGDPPRRRGQTRESGDAGGRATPVRLPRAEAAIGGKPTQHPDEGAEFTHAYIRRLEPPTPGNLKIGKLHKGKNNVISGFIRSLVLNTLIFIDAIAT